MEELPEYSHNPYVVPNVIVAKKVHDKNNVQFTIICGYCLFLLGTGLIVYGAIRNGYIVLMFGAAFFLAGILFAIAKRKEIPPISEYV